MQTNTTLYQLKETGHDLIYELVDLGMRLNGHRGIYERLRRKLKCKSGKEHFGAMNTFAEVHAALDVLDKMVKRKKGLKISKDERSGIVPKAERERIFAEIAKENAAREGYPQA